MAEAYIGEIRIWAFGWAPRGWALCNGALLPVNQNTALFSLLLNTFGGDGKTNFALPDLRGRTPVSPGTSASDSAVTYKMGNSGGAESVALTIATVPPHSHSLIAAQANATTLSPAGNLLGNVVTSKAGGSSTNFSVFLPANAWTPDAQLNAASVSTEGGGQAHSNMQPFTVVNFAICVSGYYPSRAD